MSGLGLIPNEVVGYRIKPDWYNFTVVVVKRFGTSSKKVGQEYEESLAYCKSLESASDWLIEHVTRVKAEQLQSQITKAAQLGERPAAESIANAQALMDAIQQAKHSAHEAIAELNEKLAEAGITTPKQLTHLLGSATPEELMPISTSEQ